MPIRPENKTLYPPDWPEISRRIRVERAGNKCERCKAPNGVTIARGCSHDAGTYMLDDSRTFDAETGEYLGLRRGSEYEAGGFTRIVLTVAHLDHDPTNNADDNLAALCQMHHLAHDRADNLAKRRARREAAKGPTLFDGLDAP